MITYSQDYSKVFEGLTKLSKVQDFILEENLHDALNTLYEVRECLNLFLNGTNMIEDADVYDGWISAIELRKEGLL